MAFECSRCNSFEDASMLLEELRLFDNQVYGVAHGLLMGYRDNVWVNAQSLFDEVKQMDCSTASAFYNALTDMLWHFGQVSFSSCCLLSFFQCTIFLFGSYNSISKCSPYPRVFIYIYLINSLFFNKYLLCCLFIVYFL